MNTTTTRQTTAKFHETETFSVGDQVNYSIGSDVFPGTVVEVGPRKAVVQRDQYVVDPEWQPDFTPGGFAGHVANNHDQKNIITRDEEGALVEFTLKFPPKAIRLFHNIPERTRGHYTPKGYNYLDSRLRHGWKAFHNYNF